MKPCNNLQYVPNLVQIIASKNMLDQSKEILNESGSEFSSLFILAHSPQTTILQYEEINSYTFITFLSDVGGIMGVFLGISIWSLYSMFVAPFTRKIDDLLTDKK